ncbi:MAG: PAS domain S-box protein [Chloroflexi bacterium]|nr:PAS domain S-box protein [Chloroflexota bacterium]
MSETTRLKSVVTCDMEGRIETISDGSVEIFGYSEAELIGKKRVSLFSPGQVVLEYVPNWLKIASVEGEYVSKTVFLRRDGTQFPAKIRITPTYKDGEQVGFCGVTEELEGVNPAEVAPNISALTKFFTWLVITRAPFLTAMIVPILIGAAWVGAQDLVSPFPTGLFWLVFFGGIFMQVAANTFNDYFDWKSGTDQANNDYFLPFTGGSRSIELGLITEKALFRVATIALLISASIGLALTLASGPGLLLFGLFGAFSAYFYTAPPLRLAARRGLGELLIGLNFGPLVTAGTVFALTGNVSAADFFIGIPVGILTTAILWINQFPDEKADKASGKINLVVVLGKKRARWGYLGLMVAAFGLVLYWVSANIFPLGALLFLGGLPIAVYTSRVILREYADRSLVRANAATIQMQLLAGLLMAAGLAWGSQIIKALGL